MWDVGFSNGDSGNDFGEGAVWIGGYYLGWDGQSFIGLQQDGGLQVIGGNCQLAGVFTYFVPEDNE